MRGSIVEVKKIHEQLTVGASEQEEPGEEHGRFTFDVKAPGGFIIEVNSLLPGLE